MKLKYITCSDPRETIKLDDLKRLTQISPKVEIGMQSHPSAMKQGLDRYIWFNEFISWAQQQRKTVNIAMHVNYQWCDAMCSGIVPTEIERWINLRNKNNDMPVIKRWQLNIGDDTFNFDADKVAKLIMAFPENEFIFPYNADVAQKIDLLRHTGAKFSLLYDSSYGYGICPDKWNAPVFQNVPMGYAGGLSSENVSENLNKISSVVPDNYTTWIDAEGRLMKPDERTWDMERVHGYIQNALNWESRQKIK